MKDIGVDLGLLCQVVGRKIGVEVVEVPELTTFATDGKKVFIPSNVAGDEIDADIMRGGIAHEAAGHIRHTDFNAVAEWIDGKPNAPLAKGLENIIEDARIEMAAIREYPGCRKMLATMVGKLESKGFFSLPQEPLESAEVLCAFLIRALREKVMNQPISSDQVRPMAEQVFGKGVCDRIFALAEKGARGKSTRDVLASVDEILALLGEAANPPPPQPEESEGAGEEGEKGQPEGDQGNQGEGAGGDGPGQQQSPGGDADGKGEGSPGGEQAAGKGEGQGDEGNNPSSDIPDTVSDEQSKAARKALGASTDEVGKTDIGEMINEVLGRGAGKGRTRSMQHLDRRIPAAFDVSETASNLTTRLRSNMEALLQSRVDDEDPDMEEHGRLNPRFLARAKLGDKRVFQIEGDEGEGLSSAIHVLADSSGSMSTHGNDKAAAAVLYALSSAMAAYESQGVRFALSSFNGNLMSLKGFADPWIKAKTWIGNYQSSGGTMFTASVRSLVPELAARKERRKTLFVITDGDLGLSDENRKVCDIARREGIDVDVLCIGDKLSSGHGFRSFATVAANDPVSLQKAIFATLRKAV